MSSMATYCSKKNVKLFISHGIYTETEMKARAEIHLENYSKVINIEAQTMVDMVKRNIIPAVSSYTGSLSDSLLSKKAAVKDVPCATEETLIKKLASLNDSLYKHCSELETLLVSVPDGNGQKIANYYHELVVILPGKLPRDPVAVGVRQEVGAHIRQSPRDAVLWWKPAYQVYIGCVVTLRHRYKFFSPHNRNRWN